MYKRILIPVDLGNADKVNSLVDHAAAHCNSGCQITLLNVVEDIPSWAAAELPRGTLEKSVQSSQERLSKLAASVSADVEAEVRVGHPYQTILEVAEEKSATLIVIASHQPDLPSYLLGSTAAKVVRHAACSVLVVR